MSISPEDPSNAVLLAVGELLGREIALDDLLKNVVDRIALSMNADRGTLYLVDAARGELFSKAAHLPELKEIRLKLGQGVAGHVARSGETINASRTSHELRFFGEIDRRTGYRTRSILAMPVRDHRGRIIGVLQVLNKKGGPFNQEDEALLARLAGQAAAALEATTLYQELRRAESDPGATVSYQYNRIIGESDLMKAVYRLTQKAAATSATVLLRGESGTGKEVIARAIQVNGARRDRPFI
jgi:Nif-specific regulatory protein